jgi:hypothetical protein
MNHTVKTLAITVGVLAAVTAALTATVAINLQTVAAYTKDPNGNVTDIENSETNFSFKQKEKNNCSGFTTCCNTAAETFGSSRADLLQPEPPPAVRCGLPPPPPPID